MKKTSPITWSLLPARPRPWGQGQPPPPPMAQGLSGTWYMNGNPSQPCASRQRGPDRAVFINEKGSEAWGTIRGDRVWIPDWSDGYTQGLSGRLRGNRILGPGSYWSRYPE